MKIKRIGGKLTKNAKKIRIFGIFLGAILISGALYGLITGVKAAQGETVMVRVNTNLHANQKYGDYADGLYTQGYAVISGGTAYNALCVSPTLPAPADGSTGTAVLVTNTDIKKMFLASILGPYYNHSYWVSSVDSYADDFQKAHSIIGAMFTGATISGNSWTQPSANVLYNLRDSILSIMSAADISGYNVYYVNIPGAQSIMWAEPVSVEPDPDPEPTTHVLYIFKRSSADNSLLNGAVFDIYNNASCSGTPATGTTGAMGHDGQIWAGNVQDGMTYCVVERTAPDGYTKDSTPKTFTGNGADVTLTFYNTPITPEPDPEPEVKYGGVKVEICDRDSGLKAAQGGASIFGTKVDIYDALNVKKLTLTVGGNGEASSATNALPVGAYYAVVSEAGTGYNGDNNTKHYFQITEANEGKLVSTGQICLEVQKKKIRIKKYDRDMTSRENAATEFVASGAGSMVGTKFSVELVSGSPVYYRGTKYEQGDNLGILITIGENGWGEVDGLPYAKYGLIEEATGEGYFTFGGVLGMDVQGEASVYSYAVGNYIYKGNMKLKKTDDDGNPMKDVNFEVESVDTGEKKVFRTDENGEIDTSKMSFEEAWFGGWEALKNGETRYQMLPYGSYIVRELRTSVNEDY